MRHVLDGGKTVDILWATVRALKYIEQGRLGGRTGVTYQVIFFL